MFSGGVSLGGISLLRYPFSTGVLSEIADYRNRIIANGGTISDTSLQAIATFIDTLKLNNIWDRFLEIAPYAGNNLNAALVKLKYSNGGQSTLTNVGFVPGDYSETTGLTGDTSGTKYLKTGFIPANNLLTSLSQHVSVYSRNSTSLSGGTAPAYIGSNTSSGRCRLERSGGTIRLFLGSSSEFLISYSATSAVVPGLLLGSSVSTNLGYLFYNNNQVGSDITFSSNALDTQESFVFGYNNSGNLLGSSSSNLICAFHSQGFGITPTEALITYNAVQVLQTSLGRQV